MRSLLYALIGLALLSGCSSGIFNYQAYEGPERLPSEVATLHATGSIWVKKIDGKGSYSPNGYSGAFPYHGAFISVLPGKHTVSLIYGPRSTQSTGAGLMDVEFTAEPEMHYRFRYTLHRREDNSQYINMWIEPFTPAQQE